MNRYIFYFYFYFFIFKDLFVLLGANAYISVHTIHYISVIKLILTKPRQRSLLVIGYGYVSHTKTH